MIWYSYANMIIYYHNLSYGVLTKNFFERIWINRLWKLIAVPKKKKIESRDSVKQNNNEDGKAACAKRVVLGGLMHMPRSHLTA